MENTKELRPKTIFLDLDGTLIHHFGNLGAQIDNEPRILDGVKETLNAWDLKGYNIILTTGRRESMRKKTEEQLCSLGIFYDQLIMSIGGGVRVLINDLKQDNTQETAIAINIERNKGIRNLKNI